MKKLLFILALTILFIGCEDAVDDSTSVTEFHYSVIQEGTMEEPVWLIDAPRKKGSPHIYIPEQNNIPVIIEYPRYITEENLIGQNAEIVLVSVTIIKE